MSSLKGRYPRWAFTLHVSDEKEKLYIDDTLCQFFCYQLERCPTSGRLHYQGYLECKSKSSLDRVKTRILKNPKAHVEIAKGTAQQNIDYCSKSETCVLDTFKMYGEPRPSQGHRTDLDDMIRHARYMPVYRVVELHGGNGLRHINHIRTFQRSLYMPDALELLMRHRYKMQQIRDSALPESEKQEALLAELQRYDEERGISA